MEGFKRFLILSRIDGDSSLLLVKSKVNASHQPTTSLDPRVDTGIKGGVIQYWARILHWGHLSRSTRFPAHMSAWRQLYFSVTIVSSLFLPRLSCSVYGFSAISVESMSLRRKRKPSSHPLTIMRSATTKVEDEASDSEKGNSIAPTLNTSPPPFRETTVANAKSLTDGFCLGSSTKDDKIILPFIGYGTYKLGKEIARPQTLKALRQGYRCIDTAFIYGGETTERLVGLAIQGKGAY